MKIIAVVLVAVSLTGCIHVEREDGAHTRALHMWGGGTLLVVPDPIVPVTCWIWDNAPSCLPNKAFEK